MWMRGIATCNIQIPSTTFSLDSSLFFIQILHIQKNTKYLSCSASFINEFTGAPCRHYKTSQSKDSSSNLICISYSAASYFFIVCECRESQVPLTLSVRCIMRWLKFEIHSLALIYLLSMPVYYLCHDQSLIDQHLKNYMDFMFKKSLNQIIKRRWSV
jgi:hypothetical protein